MNRRSFFGILGGLATLPLARFLPASPVPAPPTIPIVPDPLASAAWGRKLYREALKESLFSGEVGRFWHTVLIEDPPFVVGFEPERDYVMFAQPGSELHRYAGHRTKRATWRSFRSRAARRRALRAA